MIEGLVLVNSLLAAGASFTPRDDGAFEIEIGGVRALARTKEDLFILDEIHAKGVYDLRVPGDAVLLLDVGMNVGHASLYFAAKMSDLRIVAFEPLAPTFARAQENLTLNPKLAGRIAAVNVGLSAADGACEVQYSTRTPGLVSVFGLPADLPDRGSTTRQKIVLRDAAAVLDEVRVAHPARRIVMKVDCEGAEYDILRRLAETSRLTHVDALLIEWHRLRPEHDPAALRDLLVTEGFVCVLQHQHADVGTLYAVRPVADAISETAKGAAPLAESSLPAF